MSVTRMVLGARMVAALTVMALMASVAAGCRPAAPTGPAEPKPEDSIVRLDSDWPTYIDPAVGNDFSDSISLVNLYDSLVFPNFDGTVRPHLATRWDVSPDGLEYTFYLRTGVKFHNGDELTAEDVEFSMKRLLTIGQGFAYLFLHVTSVSVVDRYTVKMTLNEPFAPFISALVRFYVLNKRQVLANRRSGPYSDMGDYGKEWLLTNDAGSGPYKVKEMKMEEYLLAERFDDWWDGWDENAPRFFKLFASPDPVTLRQGGVIVGGAREGGTIVPGVSGAV